MGRPLGAEAQDGHTSVSCPMTPLHCLPISFLIWELLRMVSVCVHTSTRQPVEVSTSSQRVPGSGLVTTTLFVPFSLCTYSRSARSAPAGATIRARRSGLYLHGYAIHAGLGGEGAAQSRRAGRLQQGTPRTSE